MYIHSFHVYMYINICIIDIYSYVRTYIHRYIVSDTGAFAPVSWLDDSAYSWLLAGTSHGSAQVGVSPTGHGKHLQNGATVMINIYEYVFFLGLLMVS